MTFSNTAFLDNYVIIHTHVEKCGGSTLLHYLSTLFHQDHLFDLRPFPARKNFKAYWAIQKRKNNIHVLSGHIRYATHWSKLLSKPYPAKKNIFSICNTFARKEPLYVASIRHPIERLISIFGYLKTRPEHNLYNHYVQQNDIDGFIRSLINANCSLTQNGMCEQFTGRAYQQHRFVDAKHAIDHHYLAIVPYDKTHELANALATSLRLPQVEKCIINSSEIKEKFFVSEKIITLLTERCRHDIQLYDYILQSYQAKLVHAQTYVKILSGN